MLGTIKYIVAYFVYQRYQSTAVTDASKLVTKHEKKIRNKPKPEKTDLI